jgi:hypothetical protein
MKKCKNCEIEKDETEFFKKKERWFEGICKVCKRKKVLDRIALDPEKQKEKERLRSEKRRETQEWKEWRKDYQFRKRKEITEKARIYYEKNEASRKKAKEWREKNRTKLNVYNINYIKRNPLKTASRRFFRTAVESGIIIRPEKCSRCFIECKAEGHHHDYTKPLEVIWLCHSCHRREHRKHKVENECSTSK